MRRNGLLSLVFIVVLAVGGLGATFVAENEPLLGLDLQGGVSVVLQPVEETESGTLTQAIQIIRQRVDGLGVAEPEIARQGDAIVVQLPGVDDRDRALELVGQTAELQFRPVLQLLPPGGATTTTTEPDVTTTTEPDGTTTTEPDGTTTTEPGGTTTTEPGGTTTTTAAPGDGEPVPGSGASELTPSEEAEDDETVVFAEFDDGDEVARYQLGPAEAKGEILSDANARLQGVGTWIVAVEIDSDGIDQFNEIAGRCFNGDPSCPTRQLAIVLDGRVVSAPTINAASFDRDRISISGSFDEGEAKDLALVLRYGALPVELEPQQTQSVSATLGQDALDAGVTAGLVGLGLVALYMLVYYRLLGIVAILSLSISAALLWTVIAYLGETQGLALTLAGVTGIIVAIGVAVDSNVVFYEHLKEHVANGRTLRTAVDSSFSSAFSTIVKADLASLIGAGVLYLLTIGPVRGFALYLGLSTILDLVASYFFMRPLAFMLVRSKGLQHRPRAFGMPAVEEGAPA